MFYNSLPCLNVDHLVMSETKKKKDRGNEQTYILSHLYLGVKNTKEPTEVYRLIHKKLKKNIINWIEINDRIILVSDVFMHLLMTQIHKLKDVSYFSLTKVLLDNNLRK